MNNFDDLKLATEAMTGGKNTVLLDDVGMPSIMVVVPKMNSKDLVTGATDETHPAFIVDGVEKDKVYVSKFINIVNNNRAYSLPMQDPGINVTFDNSLAYCRNKGEGWGLMPASLWGAIALLCKKNGTMPHGNNNYGKDITYTNENGVETAKDSNGRTSRIATGSGPATWYHDFTNAGICDLNGNVSERCAGMRLKSGEIQIIPYANCIKAACDMGIDSTEWKAIMPDGSLTDPGTSGTIKYDYVDGKVTICSTITNTVGEENDGTGNGSTFQSISTAAKLSCPQILKELTLYPADADGYENDYFFVNNGASERFPVRGGCWYNGLGAGVFNTYFSSARSASGSSLGFRSVYYEL